MAENDEGKATPTEAEGEGVDPLTVGELISLAEAARQRGLAHDSLRKYANQGRLRAKKVGRDWETTLAAVDAYVTSRRRRRSPPRRPSPTDEQ